MSSLPVRIADTLKQFGVQVAYGEEREIEGTTFVPVALVGFGFGGGGPEEEGGGGGGGYVPSRSRRSRSRSSGSPARPSRGS
jgi:hypothetical protein